MPVRESREVLAIGRVPRRKRGGTTQANTIATRLHLRYISSKGLGADLPQALLLHRIACSSPSRTRTYNKPVTLTPRFPGGVDYLITRAGVPAVGCGALVGGLLDRLRTT